MHHRELEVRRRVVDGDARVLGDRHHDEPDERERERHTQADSRALHGRGDRRELRRAREQRQREDHHQHRRLGEGSDHHLAARADAAEARADVEPGERQQEARTAQQRDDGDHVRRVAEGEAGGEGRHQRRGDPGRGEDEVGCRAKEPRSRLGEHDVLAQEAQELAIGLQQRRPLAADEMGLELAHVAGEERREQQDQRELYKLYGERERYCHTASTMRSATRAPKTSVR